MVLKTHAISKCDGYAADDAKAMIPSRFFPGYFIMTIYFERSEK